MNMLPNILTPIEAAKALHIGRTTMYRLLKENQIKSLKIGRKILIPAKCLEEFIATSADLCYDSDCKMAGNPSVTRKEQNLCK